jgi:hypothetical protein
MKRIFITLCITLLWALNICAQMTVEEVNYQLDTRPYFKLFFGLGYKSNIVLPNSTKIMIMRALNRVLPQHFADSVFALPEVVLKNIEEYAWQQCKKDTACFEKTYAERYAMNIQNRKNYYYNECYNRSLILACGNWNVKEAIPYLEKELQDTKCDYLYPEIEMTLAKLGNDSIYKRIKESRTFAFLISHTPLDTIDNKAIYESINDVFPYKVTDFLANYLKDKDFLYDILDLLYFKGQVPFVGLDYISIEPSLLMDFSTFLFRENPNIGGWEQICRKYFNIYVDAEKNKKLYKHVSTHAYKQKMIEELRKWIDENVNFE